MGVADPIPNELPDVSPQRIVVSKVLADWWVKLGRPTTPLSKSGQKLMDIIIATWEDLFREESVLWYKEREDYKKSELPISKQVEKHTGRSLASYPMYIYQVMKGLFPNFNSTERKNCFKMCRKWPMFQMAKKL